MGSTVADASDSDSAEPVSADRERVTVHRPTVTLFALVSGLG